MNHTAEFGKLRSFFWPIHRYELGKFIPTQLILILICFNYSILRNLKDSMVITASGAEVIPFIKVWVLLPMAILFTVIFTKLSNRFSQERVAYIIISSFLLFFSFFAAFLYPMREVLQPHETARLMAELFPSAKWLIAMVDNWVLTLFYVLAELWSTIVLQVLFWGFANEITRIHEARRFYSVFSIGSNLAAFLAGGVTLIFLAEDIMSAFFGAPSTASTEMTEAAWQSSLNMLVIVIVVSGLITMGIFWWMNRNVLNDPSFEALHSAGCVPKKKKKQSLRDSFSYLRQSRYLICIAVLVVGYNLVINLVEIVWKDQLRQLHPENKEYLRFISLLLCIQALVAIASSICMAWVIKRFGWTRTALITPVIMLITSAGFFSFLFFKDQLAGFALALTGMTPLMIAVFFGSAQNCLSKAAKYSVFDATKEMAYIPLDHESKLKGKAAIDGVGSRLGKSGGSLIHTSLLMIFETLPRSSPFIAGILGTMIVFWIGATKSLGKKFNALVAQQAQDQSVVEELEPSSVVNPPAPVQNIT